MTPADGSHVSPTRGGIGWLALESIGVVEPEEVWSSRAASPRTSYAYVTRTFQAMSGLPTPESGVRQFSGIQHA